MILQRRCDGQVPQTQFIAGVCGFFFATVAGSRGGGDVGQFAAVLQHFSASVHLDVEAQGGGDAGSLTRRCSLVHLLTCIDRDVRQVQRPNHHHHHVGVGWVGRRLVLKVFSQDGFSSVLRSRSSTRTGWFSRSWTSL